MHRFRTFIANLLRVWLLFCGFYKVLLHRRYWFLSRLYCLGLVSVVLYGSYLNTLLQINKYYYYVALFLFCNYLLIVPLLLYEGGYYVERYLSGIRAIDAHLNASYKAPVYVTASIFAITVLEKAYLFIGFTIRTYPLICEMPVSFISWYMLKLTFSFNGVIRCLIFECNWQRMKILRRSLLYNISIESRISLQVDAIRKTISIYKDLLRNLERTGSPLKFSVLQELLIAMFYILMSTFGIAYSSNVFVNRYMLLESISHTITLVAPCVMMELSKVQVEDIKIILIDVCTGYEDQNLCICAEDSVKYLELCPFRYVVLRTFVTDARLPLSFLSLVTTYVIVIVQFTLAYT